MLAELSVFVSIAGTIPYVFSIIKGSVKPERVTWGIWTLILILSVVSYSAEGGGKAVWFLIGDLIVTGVVFLLSIIYGVGGWSLLDKGCLGVAGLGLVVWQVTGAPVWQLIGTLSADMVAVIPTIKKSLDDPMSDSAVPFAASSLAALMGIFSVGKWDVVLLFYPIYLYTANFLTTVVIQTSRYCAKQPKREPIIGNQ